MTKKQISAIIVISLFFVVGIPGMLEIFVFRNEINSALTNGEWGGFLGSYVGGVLSGIGTLIAVYITTQQTRMVQRDTAQQNKEDRDIEAYKERKRFADEVAGIVAKYIMDISGYFYGCRTEERLSKDKYYAERELHEIEKKISDLYEIAQQNDDKVHIESEISSFKQKESIQRYKLENIEKDIVLHRANRRVSNECYFLLQIKLQEIVEGKAVIEQMRYIHNNCMRVDEVSLEWIDEETRRLKDLTVKFIDRYVNQKLI